METETQIMEIKDKVTEYQTIDPKFVACSRVSYGLLLLIVAILVVAALVLLNVFDAPAQALPYCYAGGAVLVALFLLMTIFFPMIEYRQWRYGVSEDRLDIRHGIFWIKTAVIPMARIQHVTVKNGPIARHYGLAQLTVNTASGAFSIDGLTPAVADELCDILRRRIYDRLRVRGEL